MRTKQQKIQTFRGLIENVKNVPTHSGRKMVTFVMNEYPFKAFSNQADAVQQLEGAYVEITAKHNTFRGKGEFAVIKVAGEVGGRQIVASDSCRSAVTPLSSAPIVKNPAPPPGKPQTISSDPIAATQQIASAEKTAAGKTPELQGVISKIKSMPPTRDGRKMIIFDIGPHPCMLFNQAAEFVERNASEYEGKRIAVYGEWKTNGRGHKAFVPEECISAGQSDPAGTPTAGEVEIALQKALIEGSGVRTMNYMTFEEMEAQYYKDREERRRSEQPARSSTAAA